MPLWPGFILNPGRVGHKAYQEIKLIVTGIARGFLGPLFFATIGLHVNFGALTGVPFFLGLIIFTAFFGKLIGSGLPAYWLGFGRREALAVGVGMSSRGAVELVVLSIAYEAGVFAYGSELDPYSEVPVLGVSIYGCGSHLFYPRDSASNSSKSLCLNFFQEWCAKIAVTISSQSLSIKGMAKHSVH